MIITEIQTGQLSLPLTRPFRTALRTVERLTSVLVRVRADTGETGFGEAPPARAVTGETMASIEAAIHTFIRPAIVGQDLSDPEAVLARLQSCLPGNRSAKAAVDMALFDLYGKQMGLPLYALLGGTRTQLETDLTISLNSPEQMAEDSLAAVRQGYGILKLKVGGGDGRDLDRVAAVRAAVGPGILLRVDANQGWTPREALEIIRAMEKGKLDVQLVEQPVAAGDLKGLKTVTRGVGTLILADESVFSPEDAARMLRTEAADAINLKLMKTGGIYEALKLCDIAAFYGASCMMGCMLESRLAVSAAAHLAAASPVIAWIDLDGPLLCETDPFAGGPRFTPGRITLNDAPGIGITDVPCTRWQ